MRRRHVARSGRRRRSGSQALGVGREVVKRLTCSRRQASDEVSTPNPLGSPAAMRVPRAGSATSRSPRRRARSPRPATGRGRRAAGTARARTRRRAPAGPRRLDALIRPSRLPAAPFRFPFASDSPSMRTSTKIVCGSSSSTVTTHGPSDERQAVVVLHRVAGGAARDPVVHQRVAEHRRQRLGRRHAARLPAQHRRDLRLVLEPRGALGPRRPRPRARRSGARRRGRRA